MDKQEAIKVLESYTNIYNSRLEHPEDSEAFEIAIEALNEVIKSEKFVEDLVRKVFGGTSYEEWKEMQNGKTRRD